MVNHPTQVTASRGLASDWQAPPSPAIDWQPTDVDQALVDMWLTMVVASGLDLGLDPARLQAALTPARVAQALRWTQASQDANRLQG